MDVRSQVPEEIFKKGKTKDKNHIPDDIMEEIDFHLKINRKFFKYLILDEIPVDY